MPAGLSEHQARSLAEATARVNLWHGPVRSGKTIASLLRFLIAVAQAPRSGRIIVTGQTREAIAGNVFEPLMDEELFGEFADQVSYTTGAPTAKILGRTVEVIGSGDARAEKRLRGRTVVLAYADELTLVDHGFFKQLLNRMSAVGAMLFATTNPDGPKHWCKVEVIDKAEELGYRHWTWGIRDNTWLVENNPEYIDQIEREHTGLYALRFIQGLWAVGTGACWPMWDENLHVIKASELPAMDRIITTGVDAGSDHPSRGYLIGMGPGPNGPSLYVFHEWAPKQGTAPSDQVSQYAAHFLPYSPERHNVDGAAKWLRDQLFRAGINSFPAHKAVEPGIQTIASLLSLGRLFVADDCQHLLDEIPELRWDPKNPGRVVKERDDSCDAMRYGIQSTIGIWGSSIPLTAVAHTKPDDGDLEQAA